MNVLTAIESLEPRIAPATVAFNDALHTATWTDFDGDVVTLKYTSNDRPMFDVSDEDLGLIVNRISLDPAKHGGATFSLTVKTGPIGDGFVGIGRVDAPGVPLKGWTSPKATIAEFDAGNSTIGIGKLTVAGLGINPITAFPDTIGNGVSLIAGKTGSIQINGDLGATRLEVTAGDSIGSISIAGSLRGDWTGAGATNGYLSANAPAIGKVFVGGSLIGGDNVADGRIAINGAVGSLTILGSIVGGFGIESGSVEIDAAKVILIGGNVIGGTEVSSGHVIAKGAVGTFTLKGSIIGGSESNTGNVDLSSATSVKILGSIIGSKDPTSNNLIPRIATLNVANDLKNLFINGDIIGGTHDFTPVSYHGAVIVGGNLGTATIKGALIGNEDTYATILVRGTAGSPLAIGKLTIGGSVEHAYIAAGHGIDTNGIENRIGVAENLNASIGTVTIGGNFVHSNLSAGVSDMNSSGLNPSDNGGDFDGALVAAIKSVVIKGAILDNAEFSGASGIAAQKILSVKTGGTLVFKTGDANRTFDPNGDVIVFEVSP